MFGFIIRRITGMKFKELVKAHIPDYKWLIINVLNSLSKPQR